MYEELEELKPNTFTQAADLIVSKGWTQGNYDDFDDLAACASDGDDDHGFCALGALSYVLTNGCDTASVAGTRESHVALLMGVSHVADWNDHPETTKTEVVTRLRAASHIMAHGFEAPVLAEWVGDA